MVHYTSPLEKIEPIKAARYILFYSKCLCFIIILYEIVLVLSFIDWESGSWYTIAASASPAFILLPILILITILTYFVLSRLAIAPLMTWHFTRENTLATHAILDHLEAKDLKHQEVFAEE